MATEVESGPPDAVVARTTKVAFLAPGLGLGYKECYGYIGRLRTIGDVVVAIGVG